MNNYYQWLGAITGLAAVGLYFFLRNYFDKLWGVG